MPEFNCLSKVAMSDVIFLLCWYQYIKCSVQRKSKPKLTLKYWIFLIYYNVIRHWLLAAGTPAGGHITSTE